MASAISVFLLGFHLERENEENTSKQIKLEDTYSFIFTLEGTPIHDPISQKYYKHLKYQHEIHPDDLHSDFTKLVDDQSYFLGEKPEVSNLEEALKSSLRVQKCRGVKPLNSQSVDCFAQNSQVLGNQKSHSGKELHKCPECGEVSFVFQTFLDTNGFTQGRDPMSALYVKSNSLDRHTLECIKKDILKLKLINA